MFFIHAKACSTTARTEAISPLSLFKSGGNWTRQMPLCFDPHSGTKSGRGAVEVHRQGNGSHRVLPVLLGGLDVLGRVVAEGSHGGYTCRSPIHRPRQQCGLGRTCRLNQHFPRDIARPPLPSQILSFNGPLSMHERSSPLSLVAWLPEWPETSTSTLSALDGDSAKSLLAELFDPKRDDLYRHRLAAGVAAASHLASAVKGQLGLVIEQARQDLFCFWWRHLHDEDLLQADADPVVSADLQVEHISSLIPLLIRESTTLVSADLFWPGQRPLVARLAHRGTSVPLLNAMLEVLQTCEERIAELVAEGNSSTSFSSTTFSERDALGRYGPIRALARVCRTLRSAPQQASERKDVLAVMLRFANADATRGAISSVFQSLLEIWSADISDKEVVSGLSDYTRQRQVSMHLVAEDRMPCCQDPEKARTRTEPLLKALESDPTNAGAAESLERYCMAREASSEADALSRMISILVDPRTSNRVRERIAGSLRTMLQFVTGEHVDSMIAAADVLGEQREFDSAKDVLYVLLDAALLVEELDVCERREAVLAYFRRLNDEKARRTVAGLGDGIDLLLAVRKLQAITQTPDTFATEQADTAINTMVRNTFSGHPRNSERANPYCLSGRLEISILHRAGIRLFQTNRAIEWKRATELANGAV